jgi:glycine/D-amino acid oxidase-like deaminating enzyme/nitrite reductase/ring-hydroxylating ferredoxin subunit
MIKRDGNNISVWQGCVDEYRSQNKVDVATLYDVAIVGGGITGISTAISLQEAGMKCIVFEANNLCFGTTGGTTAHLNTLLDTPYHIIAEKFTNEKAKLVATSVKEAINLIQFNINKYKIKCGFEITTATLFAKYAQQKHELEKIHKATKEAGVPNKYVEEISVPIRFIKAIQVGAQAKFNPVEYVYGLASAFENAGGVIAQECRVISASENETITIETSKGKFLSKRLIYATHVPPGVNLLHFRCIPYRSYAMAVTLKNREYPADLVYDMFDPYHYYRSQEINGQTYFIVGGYDHKTAHENNQEYSFLQLESHIRKYFDVDEVIYKWSSQYYEPADGIPYIGLLPGHSNNVFVATGFGGNGMTYGTVASSLLKKIIFGEESPYKDIYDPNRLKPVAGFTNFVKHNSDVVKQFVNKFVPVEKLEELADLAIGEGRIVKYNDERIGIFKDNEGRLHAINPTCTHLGCEVKWNNAELTWDCPCHGARYSYNGRLLTGPASHDLPCYNVKELVSKG